MAAWRLWPVDITRCCTSSQVMFFLACKPAIYFLLVFWGLFFCLWLWLQYVICSSVFGSADWLDTTVERNNRKQPKKNPPKHCVSGRLLGSEKLIRARIHPAAVDSLIINKKKTHTHKNQEFHRWGGALDQFCFFKKKFPPPWQTFIILSLWYRWIFLSSVYKCQTSTGFLCTLYPGERSCFQPIFPCDWKYYLVINHCDIVQFTSLLAVGQLSGAFLFPNRNDEHTSGFNFVSYKGKNEVLVVWKENKITKMVKGDLGMYGNLLNSNIHLQPWLYGIWNVLAFLQVRPNALHVQQQYQVFGRHWPQAIQFNSVQL